MPWLRWVAARGSFGIAVSALALAMVMTAGSAAPARAAGTGYLVTFAARSCPAYTDITGNRARNDIMESLENLGADTLYQGGEPISVAKENAGQPNCTPITGWTFTIGDGIAGQVTGPFGQLSVVGGADGAPVTLATTPELDAAGARTGRTIPGAVTVELTPDQLRRSEQGMRLWAQGGTPTDPVNQARFPDRYGFGSLRCAVDNLNGDNVEFIAFPQGDRHVFCYAYYVTPPPTSATIRIVKQVPAGDTSSETFQFGGTVSYNPGGSFDLQVVNGAPASETFVRAETRTGVAPWVVTETSPPDWRLRGAPVCTTTNGSTFVIVGDRVEITLKARDEAVCTYTNEPIPATQLTLRKVTLGGVGRFDFRVTPAGLPVVTTSITTTQPGVAVAAPPIATTATSYDITETAPTSALGTWRLAAVRCDGVAMPVSQPVHVTVVNGEQPVCTFTNAFVPRGSLTIRKITLGATASLDFLVTRPNDPEFNAFKTATTTSIGVAATAKGDPTNALALGTYHVDELTPTTGSGGTWALTSVVCDGSRLRPINLGSISVTLTPAKPHQTCVFTDTFTADPTPNPSGGVLPTDGGLTPPPTATLAAVASVPRTPGLAIALGLIFASLVVAVLALQSRRAR